MLKGKNTAPDNSIALNEELMLVRFEKLILGLCNHFAAMEINEPSGRRNWNNKISLTKENVTMVIEYVGQWAFAAFAAMAAGINPNFGTHRLMSVDEAINQPIDELIEVMRLGNSWYKNAEVDKVGVLSRSRKLG